MVTNEQESSRVSNYLNLFLRVSAPSVKFKKVLEMMDMKSLLVILSFLKFVSATREGNIIALSEEEYDVMLKKIVGEFTKPSNERNKLELKMIRKYIGG